MSLNKSGENGSSGNSISSSGATAVATTAGATTTTNAAPSTVTNNTSGTSSSSAVPQANATISTNGSSSTSAASQAQNPPQKSTGNAGKSTGSSVNGENGTSRGRKDRPCDACRRRKSRCVMNEGAEICVLCQFHSQECTFVQSPQPRKRRLASSSVQGSEEPSVNKKRYVVLLFVTGRFYKNAERAMKGIHRSESLV